MGILRSLVQSFSNIRSRKSRGLAGLRLQRKMGRVEFWGMAARTQQGIILCPLVAS